MKAVLYKIICPSGDELPVFVNIERVALLLADLSGEGNHVASLFQRHIAAINLTICFGILAEVVCCERLRPATREAVVEDRCHHTLLQFRIVTEIQRSFRIGEVNGIDAAVGVVLL